VTDQDPIKTAVRSTKRKQRLGKGAHACLLCGYSEPEGLVPVKPEWLEAHGVPRCLLEEHHLVGHKRDRELVALLCRNCHAKATEGLLREGISMQPEDNPKALVATMLDALAVFLEMLAAAVRRWAEMLRQAVTPEASNA
jgi:hypothetical protein